ncbi:hypothetical protein N0V88_003418 [Collariella sp. IMI 366227]|nr:hypothetical protein N0V88_003418 [Collariella sp. IMI 366227]
MAGAMWSRSGQEDGAFLHDGISPQAQIIDQRTFNALHDVPPPSEAKGFTFEQFVPPGATHESLLARPFHIYDAEFLDIIGPNPTLTLLAQTDSDPIFHEAPVWYPAKDEMFFAQNAGAAAAGTGLAKSAVIQKIPLSEIGPAIANQRNASGSVRVEVVHSSPTVINPNGGTNYRGQLLFLGEGQGENIAPAMYLMNPEPPYNTTVLLDNFFGRQFNSLNDVSINPRTGEIYFTDPTYGYVQDFRPAPGLPKQVWRFSETTGAVAVAADGFNMPNGICFSPDGMYLYITDTGMAQALFGTNLTFSSTIYRYDVQEDGTLDNRKTFAFVTPGIPDGIHVDTRGNVYTGCGDGVQVYNPSGKLIGKIYVGSTVANFQFAGKGRLVMLAETELYYVTLAADGAFPAAPDPATMTGAKRARLEADEGDDRPEHPPTSIPPSKRRRVLNPPTTNLTTPQYHAATTSPPLRRTPPPHFLLPLAPAPPRRRPVSHRFYQLSADSQLWKALYYARFVLPRAMRIPGVEGLRAWDLKSRSLIVQVEIGDGVDAAVPTCIAVDETEFACGVLDVALGFDDGSFGVWRLRTNDKRLERRYRHEKSSSGELIAMAFSHPYLLTATGAVLVSLYTFDIPNGIETNNAGSIRSLGGGDKARPDHPPEDLGPTTLCYTHPYLLATLPDNTLVLHMCTSSASSLSISNGIRLWGHTSGISDAEITARGKAVSVSTRGEEMRVWELEGRSSGIGSRSVEIRPWQTPGRCGALGGVVGADDGLHSGDPARDWDERRNWVGFDDEMVIVLKERKGARESLMVYDFT